MMTGSAWPNDQQAATEVPRNSGHPLRLHARATAGLRGRFSSQDVRAPPRLLCRRVGRRPDVAGRDQAAGIGAEGRRRTTTLGTSTHRTQQPCTARSSRSRRTRTSRLPRSKPATSPTPAPPPSARARRATRACPSDAQRVSAVSALRLGVPLHKNRADFAEALLIAQPWVCGTTSSIAAPRLHVRLRSPGATCVPLLAPGLTRLVADCGDRSHLGRGG